MRRLRYRIRFWLYWDRLWGAQWRWLTDGDELPAKLRGMYGSSIARAVNRPSVLMQYIEE